MSGHLSYRLAERNDLPQLRRLWEQEAGWGKIVVTEEMWQRYVVDAPLGGISGAVAIDDETGEIVGQFVFVPSLVLVNGREVRAFRPAAPILAKSARKIRSPNPFQHPLVAMYRHSVKLLRERGDGLLYMVPDSRWVRFFRMFPNLHCGSFPLWRIDLPLAAPLPLGEGFEVKALAGWDERVDRLGKQWASLYGCSVVRDSRTLPWKIGGGEYIIQSIERNGEMVGMVASRKKGDRQWLVCDVMAADDGDSLRATLAAVANLAHERATAAPPERPIRKVAALITPVMERVARELGFVRDAYDFPVVVHILDSSITKEMVAPARWYVSAND